MAVPTSSRSICATLTRRTTSRTPSASSSAAAAVCCLRSVVGTDGLRNSFPTFCKLQGRRRSVVLSREHANRASLTDKENHDDEHAQHFPLEQPPRRPRRLHLEESSPRTAHRCRCGCIRRDQRNSCPSWWIRHRPGADHHGSDRTSDCSARAAAGPAAQPGPPDRSADAGRDRPDRGRRGSSAEQRRSHGHGPAQHRRRNRVHGPECLRTASRSAHLVVGSPRTGATKDHDR